MSLITDKINYSWYCVLPGNLIAQNLVNLLKADAKFNEVFYHNIYPYRRDDNQSRQLPALNIYPKQLSGQNQAAYHSGTISFDFTLPLEIIRDKETEVSATLLALITYKSKVDHWLFTLRKQGVPGLIELGKVYSASSGNFISDKSKEAWNLAYTMNYKVDMLAVFEYINLHGLDIKDPCKQTGGILTGSIPMPSLEPEVKVLSEEK